MNQDEIDSEIASASVLTPLSLPLRTGEKIVSVASRAFHAPPSASRTSEGPAPAAGRSSRRHRAASDAPRVSAASLTVALAKPVATRCAPSR